MFVVTALLGVLEKILNLYMGGKGHNGPSFSQVTVGISKEKEIITNPSTLCSPPQIICLNGRGDCQINCLCCFPSVVRKIRL